MIKIEIWQDIKGYEKLYQISNHGNIKSLNFRRTGKEKIMKPLKKKDGYLKIQLFKKGKYKCFYIHRLVAEAFLPNPFNYNFVNHIDENKSNNNVSNLEYCTLEYNNSYGKSKNKKKNNTLIKQYDLNGNLIRKWRSLKQIKDETKYSYYGIFNCLHNRQNTSENFKWEYEVIDNGSVGLPLVQN